MSTITPSRNLDELTTEQPNDKTCTAHKVGRRVVDGIIVQTTQITPDCGAPATHSVFHTCCGAPIRYLCSDHAHPFQIHGAAVLCSNCTHECFRGTCYHRIITPL